MAWYIWGRIYSTNYEGGTRALICFTSLISLLFSLPSVVLLVLSIYNLYDNSVQHVCWCGWCGCYVLMLVLSIYNPFDSSVQCVCRRGWSGCCVLLTRSPVCFAPPVHVFCCSHLWQALTGKKSTGPHTCSQKKKSKKCKRKSTCIWAFIFLLVSFDKMEDLL